MPENVSLNSDELEILACALASEVSRDRNWLIRRIRQEVFMTDIVEDAKLICQKEELMLRMNHILMIK